MGPTVITKYMPTWNAVAGGIGRKGHPAAVVERCSAVMVAVSLSRLRGAATARDMPAYICHRGPTVGTAAENWRTHLGLRPVTGNGMYDMNLGRPLAATLACAMLLTACGASTGTPTTPASASATPTDRSSQAPTSAPSEESASPAATPSASLPAITSWRATATFDSDPGTSYVTDVTAWSGGFVAIGSAWESEFHVTQEMPAVWTSGDGQSWDEQPVELGVDDVSLIGVAPRADGRLLLVGRVPGTGAIPEQPAPASVAWVSDDAVTWQAVDLPLPDGAFVTSFDHGPRGYALVAEQAIWFSTDGTDWTMTFEGAGSVVAGDEGFVAMVFPEAAGPSEVVASGDGQTWYPSGLIAAPLLDVTALGGDWVATGYSGDPSTIMVWHSANGLDWVPQLDVNDLTGPDGPKTGRGLNELALGGASLAGGEGYAFLTLTNNHCCAQMSWNYGVWGSADGMTWVPVVEGDAFVSSVASSGDTTVLAGHLGRGEDAAFWIGDR